MSQESQQVIEQFRARGGRVDGPYAGTRLILLTTVSSTDGEPRTTPVRFLPDGGERIVAVALDGENTPWLDDLVANGEVTVEDGVFTYGARAEVLTDSERDDLVERAAESGWGAAAVVALYEVAGGPPNARTFGEGLRLIHDAFRREFALVRAEVAASGPGIGAQLRVNCLTACQYLHRHHTMEDAGLFPSVAARFPEVAPVIDRLSAQHEAIAALLAELQTVLTTPEQDRQRVLAEVDRLVEAVQEHLAYEEEQLIPLLDVA